MKKKIFILVMTSALLLSSCTVMADSKDDRIAELEAQVAELQSKIDELQQSSDENADQSEDLVADSLEVLYYDALPDVYSADGIQVSVQKVEYDSYHYQIEFMVTNDSSEEFRLGLTDSDVDDFEVSTFTGNSTIASGKKGICEFGIREADFTDYGIDDFEVWNANVAINQYAENEIDIPIKIYKTAFSTSAPADQAGDSSDGNQFVDAVQAAIAGDVGSGESITRIILSARELTIDVDLSGADTSLISAQDIAIARTSTITDTIISMTDYYDSWDSITVDFGSVGKIRNDKSNIVTNEYNLSYFDSANFVLE